VVQKGTNDRIYSTPSFFATLQNDIFETESQVIIIPPPPKNDNLTLGYPALDYEMESPGLLFLQPGIKLLK